MARPIKDGVEYFPKDTNFYSDDKIRLLRAEFGAKGMYVLDYLLCDLYGKNGYFTKWDKSKCFLVSDGAGCGCSPEYIEELISGCFRCSFFDKRVFDLFGVLTSQGIQRRYIRMFNSREEIQIYSEYWLLDSGNKKDVPTGVLGKIVLKPLKSTGNPDKSTGNPDKSTGNTQSKDKVDEIILSIVPTELVKVFKSFNKMRNKLKKPMTEEAITLVIDKLEKLAPGDYEKQKAILNQSIMNSWQGVFKLKDEPDIAQQTQKKEYKEF